MHLYCYLCSCSLSCLSPRSLPCISILASIPTCVLLPCSLSVPQFQINHDVSMQLLDKCMATACGIIIVLLIIILASFLLFWIMSLCYIFFIFPMIYVRILLFLKCIDFCVVCCDPLKLWPLRLILVKHICLASSDQTPDQPDPPFRTSSGCPNHLEGTCKSYGCYGRNLV